VVVFVVGLVRERVLCLPVYGGILGVGFFALPVFVFFSLTVVFVLSATCTVRSNS